MEEKTQIKNGTEALNKAHVKHSSGWIKVADHLPSEGDKVIFGANNITDMQNRLCKPMTMAGWFSGGNFYSWLTKEKLKATHWMPMPILRNGE